MRILSSLKRIGQSNGKEDGQYILGNRDISLHLGHNIRAKTGGVADGGYRQVYRSADAQAADSRVVAGGGEGWEAAADARVWDGGCGVERSGHAGDGLSDSIDHQDVRGQRDDDAPA